MKWDYFTMLVMTGFGDIATRALAMRDDPVTQTSSSLQNANII